MGCLGGMARPSKFTQDLADTICNLLIEGDSLRGICRDDDMPAAGTVCRWLSENETFREQYARAREFQAESMFDEMFEIADDGQNDWMERLDKNGEVIGEVLNHEHVQRSKLRIDTRKWALARMAPKKYGDKIAHVGGDDDDKPIKAEVTTIQLVAPKVGTPTD